MSIVMPNDLQLEEMIAAMKRLLKISARMYMHLTKATVKRFARPGEMTIRLGLRRYGYWRGIEMREAHHAMGLEINMKNLIGCWDNASTYIVKDSMESEGTFKPYDSRHDVPYCPAAEAWQDAEFFQYGHMYCDEFHQACASTYHPDGHVVIPLNMMKGDDHCHFQWVMPPDAQRLELGVPSDLGVKLARDYGGSTDIEAAWRSLKRSNRLVGGRFHSHVSVILDRHGEEGRDVILEALEAWGTERGQLMRKQHQEAGLEISLSNFVRHHDMPAQFVWRHSATVGPRSAVIEIAETPHDEALEDLNGLELAGLWYEGSYPAMAQAYIPGVKASWTQLQSKGGAVNRLEINI